MTVWSSVSSRRRAAGGNCARCVDSATARNGDDATVLGKVVAVLRRL
ncbi:hypothetical protein ACFV0O_35640 [Kitasatospora sp. NPDC059577]